MGTNLLVAFGLMLIAEGLMPLLAPDRWRDAVRRIAAMRDGQIRFMGLGATAAGVLLLLVAA